jgi:hypothetical protein
VKLIDGDKLKKHLDYLIQKERQLAKECSLFPNNEFERQRRYCFEADALAYELCENVMNYYLVADTQVMNQPTIEGAVNRCKMIPYKPDCRGYTDTFLCTNCQLHIHLGFIGQRYGGNYCIECGAEVEDGDVE